MVIFFFFVDLILYKLINLVVYRVIFWELIYFGFLYDWFESLSIINIYRIYNDNVIIYSLNIFLFLELYFKGNVLIVYNI